MSRLSLFDAMKAAGIDPETAPMRHAAAPPIRKDNLMSDAVMVPRADPDSIWLEPSCCADPSHGRQWCEDDAFPVCEDGREPVKYIRADLAASTPVGGLGSLADADTHRATEEAVVVPETTVRSYSMPRSGPTGSSVADAVILGFLHGVGRQPWDDMHDYIAVCALDYAFGKPGAREHLSAPPPPSVSIDNGSRPQEAVPTEQAEPAVVGDDGWTEWKGDKNPVPGEVVEARFAGGFVSEALDSESFGWDRHNDPVIAPMYDIVAYRVVPQPADGCSSNDGADIECPACDGSGKIVEAATTTGANQHSACQRDCEDCDGSGRILPQTEKGS